jgi:autoinducer 2-degrading protein
MICVAVTYVIQAGREGEAVEFFEKLTPASRAEPGCRFYLAHRAADDPRRFFLYEQYDDQEALDAHRASPHFQEFVANGLFLILEKREPLICHPLPE